MSADMVRVNYEELGQIAKLFDNEVSEIMQHHSRLNQHIDVLRAGGWKGEGANSFYAEMDQTLLPALKRVPQALQVGEAVLLEIIQIFQQADAETAQFFNGLGDAATQAFNLPKNLENTRNSDLKNELLRQNKQVPDLTDWLEKQMKMNADGPIARDLAAKNLAGNVALGLGPLAIIDGPIASAIDGALVGENKGAAYKEWKNMVGYKAPWDFKVELDNAGIKTVQIAGYELKYDVVANIHYGYVGAAAGFSDFELKAGAGAAQMGNDGFVNSAKRLLHDGVGNFGDDPRDQAAISAGIWLHQHPDKTLADAIAIYKDQL